MEGREGGVVEKLRLAYIYGSLITHVIWIDALCIIQDEPSDMACEITNMRGIYRGAIFTISASRATCVTEGLLHHRHAEYEQPGPCQFRVVGGDGNLGGSIILLRPGSSGHELEAPEPLQRRAWAFQERVISSRVLEFGSIRTTWQDERSGYSPEADCGWDFDPDANDNISKLRETIWRTSSTAVQRETVEKGDLWVEDDESYKAPVWSFIVQEYTKRNLTFGMDKLPALEGLAEWYRTWLGARETSYLAGIWSHHLPEGLVWRVSADSSSPRQLPRPEWRAPSWSWASVDNAISYPANPNIRRTRISATTMTAQATPIKQGTSSG